MLRTIAELDIFFGDGDPIVSVAYALILFVFGAVIASFSCLVAYRMTLLEEGEPILRAISFPPSSCDRCRRRLHAIELVPIVGWLISRGRCRSCGAEIPARYPIMELLLGVACAAPPFLFGGLIPAIPAILVIATAFLVAIIDWENSIVPEELTWVLIFAGLLLSPVETELQYRVAGAALGALGGWFMTTVPGWIRGVDARAWGDVAMAASVGAWIGCFAIPAACLAAAVVHLAICLANGAGKADGRVWTPFGPALMGVFAAFVSFHPWIMPLIRPDL